MFNAMRPSLSLSLSNDGNDEKPRTPSDDENQKTTFQKEEKPKNTNIRKTRDARLLLHAYTLLSPRRFITRGSLASDC